jgi:site-specific recombinase XerD
MKIEKFIERIKINRQFAKSTVNSYTRTLNRFNDFIRNVSLGKRSIEDTEQLKVWDVESFIGQEKIK